MKTAFLVFVCSVGFISCVTAGSLGAGSGTPMVPVDTPPSTRVKSPDVSSTGSGAGVASSGANASGSGSVDASSNSSSTGVNASSNGAGNGVLLRDPNGSISIGRSKEKMIEISQKELATESATTQGKSEITKKFESSILNQGLEVNQPQTKLVPATSTGSSVSKH